MYFRYILSSCIKYPNVCCLFYVFFRFFTFAFIHISFFLRSLFIFCSSRKKVQLTKVLCVFTLLLFFLPFHILWPFEQNSKKNYSESYLGGRSENVDLSSSYPLYLPFFSSLFRNKLKEINHRIDITYSRLALLSTVLHRNW